MVSNPSNMRTAIGNGGASGRSGLPSGGVRLQEEQHEGPKYRILLVGNDCISKDVGAKLRRAGYSLVKLDDVPAGMEAASAVKFDYAVIDADGMGPNDLAKWLTAFFANGSTQNCVTGTACP